MGNEGTQIVFQLRYHDAKVIAEDFAHKFYVDDFVNHSQFNMFIQLLIRGMVSEGFSREI